MQKKQFIAISMLAGFLLSGTYGVAQQLPRYTPEANQSAQRDTRTRVYLTPTRVLWEQNPGGKAISGSENLLKPGNGQSVLDTENPCILRNTPEGKAALLLDFGKEIQGGLQIITGQMANHDPVRVRIRFGESASEAMCEIDGVNGAVNDHAMRDFIISLPWLGVTEVGNSGFRFARLDLLDDNAEIILKEVRAISVFQDIPYIGSFKSNDERLNQIWETGAYTVHLNLQDYLWDGIKRDRLVWVGDLHPEVMTVNTVFGYNDAVPKSLDLARNTTQLPKWMNNISSYSLWWILIHRDWYYYHGDLDYLLQQRPYMMDLLSLLLTKIDENGKETLDSRFLDWPSSPNVQGVDAGLQALMMMTFRAASELCEVMQEKDMAAQCKKAVDKLKQYTPEPNGLKQAVALMALSGSMPPDKADKMISHNGAEGFSTFYGYYMLQAQAKAGNYQGALDCIRSYWGGMLDLGATTFWEDFNLEWLKNASRIDEVPVAGKIDVHKSYGGYCYTGYRHSFCHGWASGPTSWLSEHVLGVQVVAPGCKTVRIRPHLGDLKWVEGTFPTPYGAIKIRHEKQANGTIKSDIKVPKGVKVLR